MPKRKVYLETTIPSYLASWPSRDLITAAHQPITREWWETRGPEFDLFVSALVIEEASAGDESASARRLEVIRDVPLLELTDEVVEFGTVLVKRGAIPELQSEDALHVAVAVVHGMDYPSDVESLTYCQGRGKKPDREHLPYYGVRSANYLHAGRIT